MSEVIRCKDCRYFRSWGGKSNAHECARGVFISPCYSDFCSHAEAEEKCELDKETKKELMDLIHQKDQEINALKEQLKFSEVYQQKLKERDEADKINLEKDLYHSFSLNLYRVPFERGVI